MLSRALFRPTSGSSFLGNSLRRFNFGSGGSGGSGFDKLINLLIGRLPNHNIAFLIIALNSLFYFLYLTWPRH